MGMLNIFKRKGSIDRLIKDAERGTARTNKLFNSLNRRLMKNTFEPPEDVKKIHDTTYGRMKDILGESMVDKKSLYLKNGYNQRAGISEDSEKRRVILLDDGILSPNDPALHLYTRYNNDESDDLEGYLSNVISHEYGHLVLNEAHKYTQEENEAFAFWLGDYISQKRTPPEIFASYDGLDTKEVTKNYAFLSQASSIVKPSTIANNLRGVLDCAES